MTGARLHGERRRNESLCDAGAGCAGQAPLAPFASLANLVLFLFLGAVGATATASTGAPTEPVRVTHVTDGDTLWVRGTEGTRRSVRLQGIDAPESCQPYGAQSREALLRRLDGQRVALRTRGRDDFQREIGDVRHRGEDIGAWLVANGHAWAQRFHGRPSPARYAKLEAQAREAHRGLWAEGSPMHPQEFRRRHGRCPR